MRRFLLAMVVALLGFVFTMASAEAQGYQVRPGDVLQVDVLEDPDLGRQALVLPDGRIAFPLIGTIPVSGRTLDQINEAIAIALEPNFAVRPSVFTSLASLSAPPAAGAAAAPPAEQLMRIYVMGEVNGGPGPREVRPGTHILQLFSAMGGFTPFAATRRVQLRRFDPSGGQEHVYHIDYRALERGSPFSGPVILREGDVILVPERRLFE
jgi:polysaccharide biosynthesis/export protein